MSIMTDKLTDLINGKYKFAIPKITYLNIKSMVNHKNNVIVPIKMKFSDEQLIEYLNGIDYDEDMRVLTYSTDFGTGNEYIHYYFSKFNGELFGLVEGWLETFKDTPYFEVYGISDDMIEVIDEILTSINYNKDEAQQFFNCIKRYVR